MKPCIEFLGYELDNQKAKCIKTNLEGGYHRPPMSNEELKVVFEKPFTIDELEYFNKTKTETVNKLLSNSINHSTSLSW